MHNTRLASARCCLAGAAIAGIVAVSAACTSPAVTPAPPTSSTALRPSTAAPAASATPPAAATPRDATYSIAGRLIELRNGVSELPAAPGSASVIVTRYFGNEAQGDLNGDGLPDTGAILTQTTGGSGTFFYAVAALRTPDGWRGTNAVLLGDRIAPQPSEIRGGVLIVNYADRLPGEPMTARPSLGVSKYLRIVGSTLAE